jgi:hypothetical protein
MYQLQISWTHSKKTGSVSRHPHCNLCAFIAIWPGLGVWADEIQLVYAQASSDGAQIISCAIQTSFQAATKYWPLACVCSVSRWHILRQQSVVFA